MGTPPAKSVKEAVGRPVVRENDTESPTATLDEFRREVHVDDAVLRSPGVCAVSGATFCGTTRTPSSKWCVVAVADAELVEVEVVVPVVVAAALEEDEEEEEEALLLLWMEGILRRRRSAREGDGRMEVEEEEMCVVTV